MGKKQQVQESEAERLQAEMGAQQMADWQARWKPVLMKFAADAEKAGAADSPERRRAEAMRGIDTAARFAQGQEAALRSASQSGAFGSARQKLAVTGMGADQATSNAFGRVAADQAVTDATTQGLGTAAQMGRSGFNTAARAVGGQADVQSRMAQQDAELSLANRAGNAQLAAAAIGAGIGLWQGMPKTPDDGLGSVPGGYTGADGVRVNNPSAWTTGG